MSALIDVCRFNPTAGGTTNWTYSTAVTGYQSPTAAGAVNGAIYSYRAESADLSQWEVGFGAYNSGTGVFARTTVLFNSAGTTAKINFSAAPQVAIVALAEDLATPAILRGFLSGLTLSAAGATATFGVAVGSAVDSTNIDYLALASAFTKTTSAWAVGTANGALDTGTIANGTWYHVFLIKRPDTRVVDVLVSLSATAPTLPTNYTLFRRIGAMLTDGSAKWVKFSQVGDEFLWDVRKTDVANGTTAVTSGTLHVLSVPSGVKVRARTTFRMDSGTGSVGGLLSSPDESDQAPSGMVNSAIVAAGTVTVTFAPVDVRTNTSGQVRVRFTATTATYGIGTYGWFDRRGQDG